MYISFVGSLRSKTSLNTRSTRRTVLFLCCTLCPVVQGMLTTIDRLRSQGRLTLICAVLSHHRSESSIFGRTPKSNATRGGELKKSTRTTFEGCLDSLPARGFLPLGHDNRPAVCRQLWVEVVVFSLRTITTIPLLQHCCLPSAVPVRKHHTTAAYQISYGFGKMPQDFALSVLCPHLEEMVMPMLVIVSRNLGAEKNRLGWRWRCVCLSDLRQELIGRGVGLSACAVVCPERKGGRSSGMVAGCGDRGGKDGGTTLIPREPVTFGTRRIFCRPKKVYPKFLCFVLHPPGKKKHDSAPPLPGCAQRREYYNNAAFFFRGNALKCIRCNAWCRAVRKSAHTTIHG